MNRRLGSRSRAGAIALVATVALFGARAGLADSTPVGPLPKGPVSTTTTRAGQLVAVALPRPGRSTGLVWRVARRFDATVVRQVSEADVGSNVVLVFKVVGRGQTSLVFALTRGDTSAKAVKAVTYKIRSVTI